MRMLILLAVLFAAPAAWAADCTNPHSQADMTQCAGQDQHRLDAQLNTMYGQIQQRLKSDPDTAKLLTASQRAWVAFRDAECGFSSVGAKSGTIYPMIYSICVSRLTQSRVEDLKRYLSCKEGDMDCPVPGA